MKKIINDLIGKHCLKKYVVQENALKFQLRLDFRKVLNFKLYHLHRGTSHSKDYFIVSIYTNKKRPVDLHLQYWAITFIIVWKNIIYNLYHCVSLMNFLIFDNLFLKGNKFFIILHKLHYLLHWMWYTIF